jgi:hypothetical protein
MSQVVDLPRSLISVSYDKFYPRFLRKPLGVALRQIAYEETRIILHITNTIDITNIVS